MYEKRDYSNKIILMNLWRFYKEYFHTEMNTDDTKL